MNLSELITEQQNPMSMNIDEVDTISFLNIMIEDNKMVNEAVSKELPNIEKAINCASERFIDGGRFIYCGAGTSGRLGALDAIELTPTFSVSSDRAFGIIAGGKAAMFGAIEGAEDSEELAVSELKNVKLTEKDTVIVIAASGRTPYAIGAINYANEIGALTIALSCNKNSEISKIANIAITPVTGPEIITGSTRLKAGSAQKLVLNMISTGIMVKSGKVYRNLMVHVQPTNEKLILRSINIIMKATGVNKTTAATLFENAKKNVSVAIVMHETSLDYLQTVKALEDAQDVVSKAISNNI